MYTLKLLSIVVAFAMNCNRLCVCVIRPNTHIVTSEVFFAYLEPVGVVKNCWFGNMDEDVHDKQLLDLNETKWIEIEEDVTILPFSNTTCGVHGNVTANNYISLWFLKAEYDDGTWDYGKVEIAKLVERETIVTDIKSDVGSVTIACSARRNHSRHCMIVDDAGERWHQCELVTIIRTNRTFDCYVDDWNEESKIHEQINVSVKNSLVSGSVEETHTSTILRCAFDNRAFHVSHAELPYLKGTIQIEDYKCNERYSSYDTEKDSSSGAFEILKPLRSNEIGLWRIVGYANTSSAGCLFYLSENKTQTIERELELIEDKVINVYDPDYKHRHHASLPEVAYVLPFALEDCFIQDPNNEIHVPDPREFQNHSTYGKCSFSKLPIIAGIWKFVAFGADWHNEVMRDVKVNVESRMGKQVTRTVAAKKKETVQLLCQSAFEDPIAYCAFMDPQHRMHVLATTTRTKSEGSLQYHGRGLLYGDCGIKIQRVRYEDFGEWQCQFRILPNDAASIFSIELKEKHR